MAIRYNTIGMDGVLSGSQLERKKQRLAQISRSNSTLKEHQGVQDLELPHGRPALRKTYTEGMPSATHVSVLHTLSEVQIFCHIPLEPLQVGDFAAQHSRTPYPLGR